jgi:homospermidine synthase
MMAKKVPFNGRILMIGFGSVGHCTMPLLLRHFDMPADRITVVDADDHRAAIEPYRKQGVRYVLQPITPDNMAEVLGAHVEAGGLVLNLSVNVSSIAVMDWCRRHGVLYLDTCIEPWGHYYDNPEIPNHERTNYHLRQMALEAAKTWPSGSPTAIVTHGANPGLISHFVKAGLLEVARGMGLEARPSSKEDWARLAQATGTKVIHVAEHDTQISSRPKRPGEFVNTWSVPGFWGEGMQPAELGWGTHEKRLPDDARLHRTGPRCAIYLDRPGCLTEVRSWTPIGGPLIGYCITHGESITLSDYLTVWEDGRAVYRPTVHYAYHPCDDAVLSVRELVMSNWRVQPEARILGEDIVDGIDELGALLMGDFGALWYGSQLGIHEARALLGPQFNATSIQIAAPVVAGALWMLENPDRGLVEPEELDHEYILDICRPYLGPVVAERSDWTPLKGRSVLFDEPGLDFSDPWQFQNFRVT